APPPTSNNSPTSTAAGPCFRGSGKGILDFRFWILDLVSITNGGHAWCRNMAFSEQQFKDRTKAVGLRIINLVESLPSTRGTKVLGDQLLRSGTSIGAN